MSDTYALTQGRYYIGDPGLIIKKTVEGDQFIEQLWDVFYKDMHRFHQLNIKGITLFIMRTKSGDGMYGDIGTDTGTIMIMNLNQVKDDPRFYAKDSLNGCHYMDVDHAISVRMDDYNLYFSNGYEVITNR